jgi:hypothetical protein
MNGNNLNNVRREAFGHKKREYLKDTINEFATNNRNKNQSCTEE